MAIVLWSLWKHRNLKLWQNEHELCVHAECARHLKDEWLTAHTPLRNSPMKQVQKQVGENPQHAFQPQAQHVIQAPSVSSLWQKQQLGRMKCNINVSFSSL